MQKAVAILCSIFFFATVSYAQPIKGTYAIKNVETGLLLRVKDAGKANGTPLVLYTPVDWKCMTWDFQSTGENTYRLKNLFTGKTFQPVSDSAGEGNLLQQQPLLSTADQQEYEFIAAEKNSYYIRLKGTSFFLSAAGEGGVNSAVVLARKDGSSQQRWTIYEQHPVQ